MKRAFLALAAVLVAAAVLVGATLFFLIRRNLPDLSVPRIPGLRAAVTVSFDDRGVALVKAETPLDALRVQGYLTARERLFQVELERRAAAGTLSELFGSATLELDRRHRTYGFARVAHAAIPLLPNEEREGLEALADGFNAFLDSHSGRLGLEFAVLRREPARFTPEDAMLVLLSMHEDLSSSWRTEAALERLTGKRAALRRFLGEEMTVDDMPLVPDAGAPPVPALPERPERTVLAAWLDAVDDARVEGIGSNSWVVSGALTKSGKPMLANDPHLGITMPAIWLPMRFEIAGRAIEGVTLPGLPGVILGRNDKIAWGFTNLYTDVQDLYRETIANGKAARGTSFEPVMKRIETIVVRGGPAESLEVRETSHGPLVLGNLALKWTALDPKTLRLPTMALSLVADESLLDAVLDESTGPAQSVVWASASGAIGWRATGLIPLRRPGTDGSLPYDGKDPENDWRGFVPQKDMPRLKDPAAGFIVTANNRVIGTSYPVPVSTHFGSASRARRIRDLIEKAKSEGRKLDRAAIEAIQFDIVSELLRVLMREVGPHLPPALATAFQGWEGRADPSSPLFLVARTARRKVGEEALRTWGVRGDVFLSETRAVDLVTASPEAFQRAGLGDKSAFLDRAAKATLAELSSRYGRDDRSWTWGDANRLAVRHPLGGIPGLSWLFDPPSFPQPGATGIVRVTGPTFGQSMRFIVDWGDPAAATLVVPFGVSGHAFSPHRFDQLPFWRNGDPDGTATRLARAATGSVLTFTP